MRLARLGFCALAIVFSSVCLYAQTVFPGSAWNVTGNTSPTEKDNIISSSYIEQGVRVFHYKTFSLVPYVSLGVTLDTQGKDWNNRLLGQAGFKLVKDFKSGMVSVSAAYGEEYRMKSGMRKSAPMFSATYWFGWDQPNAEPSAKHFFTGFPGSSWGVLGTISPVEEHNVIANVYLQQGITLAKIRKVSLVSFGEGTYMSDTKGYDWNNRVLYGGGLKVVMPGTSRVGEIGAAYEHEHRFKSGLTANCFTVFVKLWIGWHPKSGN